MADEPLTAEGGLLGLDDAGAAAMRSIHESAAQRDLHRHLPKIQGDEDYDKLAAGRRFVAPTGEIGRKPWYVHSDEDFDRVPEGEEFIDPEGQRRTKPKYEGVDFTTQMLFEASPTEKERQNARQIAQDANQNTEKGTQQNTEESFSKIVDKKSEKSWSNSAKRRQNT